MRSDDIFKGKEINALLQAAARLQEEDLAENDGGLGLSLAEVEEIAAESGIDPKYIRQAALITQNSNNDDDSFRFWGGPITIRRSFVVNRVLSQAEMETLIPTIQRIADKSGSTSSLTNSLTWTAHTARNRGSTTVTMQVEDGKTLCNLKAPVMMPGFLIHYIPLILTFMIGLPFAATNGFSATVLAISAVLLTSVFLATRMAYGKYASKRKDQIEQIEEAIQAIGVAATVEEDPVASHSSSTAVAPSVADDAKEKQRGDLLDLDEDTGPNDGKAREQRRMRE